MDAVPSGGGWMAGGSDLARALGRALAASMKRTSLGARELELNFLL